MSNRDTGDAADKAKATSDEPGDLERFFRHGVHRLIHKPPNYFPIYERHLERFRNRPVTMLEIGVFHGGSLQMWKSYLGPEAQIWGVDIDERCKALEEDQIAIRIGDQSDRSFLRKLVSEMPEIDIVLDDGGHMMQQQIRSFEEIYPHVAKTGVYLCEDVGTSYWRSYGGGFRRRGTFIEYSKDLVDRLHAESIDRSRRSTLLGYLQPWKPRPPALDDFTNSTLSMSFYENMVVFEREPRVERPDEMIGKPSF